MHFFYFWLNTNLVQIVFVFDKSLTLLNSNRYYLKAERKEGGRKKMEDILDIFLKCSLLEKKHQRISFVAWRISSRAKQDIEATRSDKDDTNEAFSCTNRQAPIYLNLQTERYRDALISALHSVCLGDSWRWLLAKAESLKYFQITIIIPKHAQNPLLISAAEISRFIRGDFFFYNDLWRETQCSDPLINASKPYQGLI